MKKLLFCSLPLLLLGCLRPPDYPNEPVISFKNLTKSTMVQGYGIEDSTWLTISFTDGDGDVGNDTTQNIFLVDSRSGYISGFVAPPVPSEGSGNGISGEISVLVQTSCCYFPDGSDPCTPSTTYPRDTVVFQLYMKDRAGHQSNTVSTTPIILLCQ